MSHPIVDEIAAGSSPVQIEAGPLAAKNGVASSDIDRLVARAKDMIAGRIPPDPIPVPPEVQAFLDRQLKEFPEPPTEKAMRYQADRISLDAIYRGVPVACFLAPDEVLSVVACGETEIFALLDRLTRDEQSKVVIWHTSPC